MKLRNPSFSCQNDKKWNHRVYYVIIIKELVHPKTVIINAVLFGNNCLQNRLSYIFAVEKLPCIEINSNKPKHNDNYANYKH